MTIVMSSFLAGAEMMTFLAPPSMWALALVASVKKPVDSTTMSAPSSAQSILAGSRSSKTLMALPPTVIAVVVVGHLAREAAEDGVVLEQVGEGLVVREVVDGHDLDVGSRRHDGAEEVATDAAEAVDSYANSHCAKSFSGGDGVPHDAARGVAPDPIGWWSRADRTVRCTGR